MRYVQVQVNRGHHPLAIHRPAMLELIRWACNYCQDTTSETIRHSSHLQSAFLKSILGAAELYGSRVMSPTITVGAALTENERNFVVGVLRGGIWGSSFIDPLPLIGRTDNLLVSKFLRSNETYQRAFEEIFQLTVDEWMICNIAMAIQLDPYNDLNQSTTLANLFEWSAASLTAEARPIQEAFRKYFDAYALTLAELKMGFAPATVEENPSFSFRFLRDRPVLSYGDNQGMIIDRKIFLETISVGPVFKLAAYMNSAEPLKHYGDACQDYAHELLNSIVNLNSEFDCGVRVVNNPPGDSMPIADILIASGESAFVIEAKGVWLNEDILNGTDTAAILNELEKKYARKRNVNPHSARSPEDRQKGLGQLALIIEGFVSGTVHGLAEASGINSATEIFPILVVQDSKIAEPLVVKFLASKFVNMFALTEFPEAGFFNVGRLKVHTPIIFDFLDLEYIESLFLQDSIFNLVREYSERSPDRKFPLSKFFQLKLAGAGRRPPIERISTHRALERLDETAAICFGRV